MVNRLNRVKSSGNMSEMKKCAPPCSLNGTGRQSGNGGLLYELQAVDFAIADTVLYLDAYPMCTKALDYYKKLVTKRAMLVAQMEAAGIPLTALGNKGNSWVWNDAPMPWEYEANV